MLATESTELASTWDFTPVFDLLRSPTWGGISHPAHDVEAITPTFVDQQSKHASGKDIDGTASKLNPRRSHTKLGDFGSLWELLGQDYHSADKTDSRDTPLNLDKSSPLELCSPLTLNELSSQDEALNAHGYSGSYPSHPSISISNTSKPCITKDTVAGHTSRSSTHLPAVTILRRAVETNPGCSDAAPLFPQTSTGSIGNADDYLDTPRAKSKAKSRVNGRKAKAKSQPFSSESSAETESDSAGNVFDRPIAKQSGVLAFVPSQVGTPTRDQHDTPPSSYDDLETGFHPDIVKNLFNGSDPIRVQCSLYRSATERRIFLMTKLLKNFPEYAQLVSSVGQAPFSPKKDVESRPVHVFVDMSNIMVGFHDSVKVSRNIPVTTRIRRVHMSFANLSLIMERGRPAAKRVLVGSDRLPSIDEAETLGYEANILNRVHKIKHTSRPYKSRKPGSHMVSGKPEMASTTEERWVEQGVDEILHLKILESLIDTVEPATIVLATGDAAEAEYSGGFMCQVERVLQRGWTVELVSFSQVTSNAYRRKDFRSKWGKQFRLIELDAYVEELFE